MTATTTVPLTPAIRDAARPLTGSAADYDPLLQLIGDARVVLLGEASHGTHEFYRERARITRRLIKEKGFVAVAVEADWPDAYRVNRWVRDLGDDHTALEALGGLSAPGRPSRLRGGVRADPIVRGSGGPATGRPSAPGRRPGTPRRPDSEGRVLLRRTERPAGQELRGVLPDYVPPWRL